MCPLGKSSVVKAMTAEPLLPGSRQCQFSQFSAACIELGVQDRGFPQCRARMLGGGRPPAQTCRDGGAPDELEQGRGEARWDFTEERAFLTKGQGQERRNWLQKGRRITAGQVSGCQSKRDGKRWKHS